MLSGRKRRLEKEDARVAKRSRALLPSRRSFIWRHARCLTRRHSLARPYCSTKLTRRATACHQCARQSKRTSSWISSVCKRPSNNRHHAGAAATTISLATKLDVCPRRDAHAARIPPTAAAFRRAASSSPSFVALGRRACRSMTLTWRCVTLSPMQMRESWLDPTVSGSTRRASCTVSPSPWRRAHSIDRHARCRLVAGMAMWCKRSLG